jgi:alkanesulfonate monooxygenase SsuD/methylene tetrahydromethanopterin reductase-like flavin-dependent oxidoreductase (luciferase family)
VQILTAPTRAAVREKLQAMLALTPAGVDTPQDVDFRAFVSGESEEYPHYLTDTGLIGTPDEIKTQLQNYIAIGISHFMLWYMDTPDMDGMQLFMEQVAPSFKSS